MSARGNVLENLDEAVDATVAETRLLTSAGVRALCRNGLVIPIIDGFDELVGSPTYADALASLRPWLQSLGGRGVLVVSARSNYFVSLYKESIRNQANSDISVSHFIAELDRWEPEKRDGYLKSCGVAEDQLRQLPPAELELLRLPFFARASIGHMLAGETDAPEGLVQKLMRGYVKREQGKLLGAGGETVVTAEDLDAFFEELAAYMMEYNTREIPIDELTFTAEVSFKSQMSPDVKNRLVALCGLDVREGRRFRFMHEILLDFFFGRRIGRNLCDENLGELQRILMRSRLTIGASRVAVGMCALKPAILAGLMRPAPTGLGASILRSNVGALLGEVFSSGRSVSNITIEGVDFPPMDLSTHGLNLVTFNNCSFESLTMANPHAKTVRFAGCNFQEFTLHGSGAGLSFNGCMMDVVSTSTPRGYAEDPAGVMQALQRAGALFISRASDTAGGSSHMAEKAEFFLQKINRRAELSIVVSTRDRLPVDSSRFGWITHKAKDWLRFLDALEGHELASLEHIDAGGAPKQRIHWAVQPEDILDRDGAVLGVREFWAALASGNYD